VHEAEFDGWDKVLLPVARRARGDGLAKLHVLGHKKVLENDDGGGAMEKACQQKARFRGNQQGEGVCQPEAAGGKRRR
jgi:hypothetical protein